MPAVSLRKVVLFALLLVLLAKSTYALEPADARRIVEARAREFLVGVHTGKQLRADEWLTQDAQNAPNFAGFGGLTMMIKQSTAQAETFGGLGSVKFKQISRSGLRYKVKAEVKYKRSHKTRDDSGAAANEDMIWELELLNQDGIWKIDR